MPYIKKSITVEYEDNSYGQKQQKTKTFSGVDQNAVLKDIEEWRYNGGYVITNKSHLVPENFTFEHAED